MRPRTRTFKRLAAGAAVALLGILLAACGGDDETADDALTGSTPESTAMEAAAEPSATASAFEDRASATEPAQSPQSTTGAEPVDPTATPEISSDEPEATTAPENQPEEQTEPEAAQEDEPQEVAVEPAPALGTIDEWHNSEPLSLDQLSGQPVLLVFWADF